MERLEAMRAFVTVAARGGFSAAARALAVSPPAVTRAIAALEERIGTRLLHRTTRNVRLTEAGTRFFGDCQRILAEVEEAEASASSSHEEPRGQIAVTASVMFGRLFVAPILMEFLAKNPRVSARALMVDRVVDLLDEGLDVAVRIAHLPDSSLAAIRVGSVRRVVCAAPRYLVKHGIPRRPSDLAHMAAVVFSPVAAPVPWSFISTRGKLGIATVTPAARLVVNTADSAIAAAVAGYGFTQVLAYQVAKELRSGRLEIVLAEFERPPVPIHVVHHEGRRASAKVRAFVDFAVKRLRAEGSTFGDPIVAGPTRSTRLRRRD